MINLDRVWKYIFVSASVITLLLMVIPGRFPATDEVFYKCAGLHWAATGQFAAPELVGRIDVNPGLDVVDFVYPPLYTFSFGVYTKIVGFSPRLCILFDSLIHLLLATLTITLARRVFNTPARFAYALGTLMLFLGTYDRPDELAMCFGIAGILCWTLNRTPANRALLSGAALGLCGSTSIGVWVFTVPMALLVAHHRGALSMRTAWRAVIAGLFVAVLCVAPILISHPDAYRQLLVHASVQPRVGETTFAGQSYWGSVLHNYMDAAIFAITFYSTLVAALIGTLLVIALGFSTLPSRDSRMFRQGTAVALGGMLFLWLIFPLHTPYFWFFAPWLMSIGASMLACCFPLFRRGMRAIVVAVIVLSFSVGVGRYARDRAIILLLPKEQSFDVNMARIRELIPTGSRVVTHDYWWALADNCHVLEPWFSHPNPIAVDYFIKDGNGSSQPGKPSSFAPYYESFAQEKHFVVIEDCLNRSPNTISGIKLARSGYGFGPLVLAANSGSRTSGVCVTNTETR